MAAIFTYKGYQCEFVDTVPGNYQCKKCSLVASRSVITTCCGENFCHDCIREPKEQNKPCPECGEEGFTFYSQVRQQRQINSLQVYCSLKEKGCDWWGPLEQLEFHLDPDQDNCKYVDTECPLNCPMTIPRIKVEQHVTKECVRRDFTCQHCNFKATYEEVVGTHLAECSCVPLQCPNLCGVTCERGAMEGHRQSCPLEELECEFSRLGCEERFKRKHQEEHTRQSTQKHMSLMVAATIKNRETIEKRLEDEVKALQSTVEKLHQKLQDQEQIFKGRIDSLQAKLKRQDQQYQQDMQCFSRLPLSNATFKIEKFNKWLEKLGKSKWSSTPLVAQGYKFIVELDLSMKFKNGERGIKVDFLAVEWELNEKLKWPVYMKFDYELLNNVADVLFTGRWVGSLRNPETESFLFATTYCTDGDIPFSKVVSKLYSGTLYFNIVNALML